MVSISLQEAAKGLQEVEETTDLARKGWELMARGGNDCNFATRNWEKSGIVME